MEKALKVKERIPHIAIRENFSINPHAREGLQVHVKDQALETKISFALASGNLIKDPYNKDWLIMEVEDGKASS